MTALVSSMVRIATCSLVFASLILTNSLSTAAETVVLGSDELTNGIPGAGALTLEQASKWFNNPQS